jgi:hypothetical protein
MPDPINHLASAIRAIAIFALFAFVIFLAA